MTFENAALRAALKPLADSWVRYQEGTSYVAQQGSDFFYGTNLRKNEVTLVPIDACRKAYELLKKPGLVQVEKDRILRAEKGKTHQ
jgi:hypothetical protein